MSNQPIAPVKKKGLSLLDRLRIKHKIELGMELEGHIGTFKLEGTSTKKILLSMGEDYIGSGTTLNQVIKLMAEFERKPISSYDKSKIKTTYVAEEEQLETKIREEVLPSKITKANGLKLHGKSFYIVKKQPSGKSSGNVFCLYNFHTRNLLWAHLDRDVLLGWLQVKYKEIEHKDI